MKIVNQIWRGGMAERVYRFIVAYKRGQDGNSPTIREIGEACGISSTSVVTYWLKRLVADGLIRRPEPIIGNRYACKIEVVGGQWGLEEVGGRSEECGAWTNEENGG